MKVEVSDEEVVFSGIDSFHAEFLHRLPAAAAADDEAVRRRLFPSPSADAADESSVDWKEIVEPELREIFESHVDRVKADVAQMAEGETLTIPIAHLEAWIHTLNQARLAIGARFEVTEEDMESVIPAESPAKYIALVQMDIYALFLSVLLQVSD